MEFSAAQIAEFLKGTVEGDKDVKVFDLSKIEEGKPGTLTFLSNPKYTHYIYDTQASIVLVNNDFKAEKDIAATLIRVEDSYQALASLLDLYQQSKPQKTGIHPTAVIEESAEIGENVYIGANAYIGEDAVIADNVKIYPTTYIGDFVSIGENTMIFPGAKIYEACVIGKNCTVHAGTVIGADGFGFAPSASNNYKKIPQVGNVIIEDYVEIGANATIDRATMGSTIIRKGVKLDNMLHVAHNVEIGENTVMAAQSGVAGSSKIGKNCMFGGQVGIAPHSKIADGAKVAAQSGISSPIKEENAMVIGSPYMDFRLFRRVYVYFKNLPQIVKRLESLEKEVGAKK
ncbi:MAG: UDP-3-O-(3-hydroxymyristoyl)glucosamine N-acyltransferase [Bacteroidales bacterium]|jgi:UDP-3-O-[3-hydroxymyristoyl] glucosamine N-acyltransferase|nr:UDP-3-O-(3-hydroxymyristoyl)glucosamine N-acyltransferase [Bacteroidales bacterium]